MADEKKKRSAEKERLREEKERLREDKRKRKQEEQLEAAKYRLEIAKTRKRRRQEEMNSVLVSKQQALAFDREVALDNNETIGQLAEFAICVCFCLMDGITALFNRGLGASRMFAAMPLCFPVLFPTVVVVEHTAKAGSPVDFKVIEDGVAKSLSVKTLMRTNGKVAGQGYAQKSIHRFDIDIMKKEASYTINPLLCQDYDAIVAQYCERFDFVQSNLAAFLEQQLDGLFCCDFLLVVSGCKEGQKSYERWERPATLNFVNMNIAPLKPYLPDTNLLNNHHEFRSYSHTIKTQSGMSIGELQFHGWVLGYNDDKKHRIEKGRAEIKFRFDANFLRSMGCVVKSVTRDI